jgi:Na+/phosphate symporter
LSNLITKTISDYLYNLSQRKLNEKEAKKILYMIRLVNELEQLGDIAEDLGLLPKKLISKGITPPKESNENLKRIYEKFEQPMKILEENFPYGNNIKMARKLSERKRIESMINKSYISNIPFLKGEKENSASFFVEAVSIFENATSKLRGILILVQKYATLEKK